MKERILAIILLFTCVAYASYAKGESQWVEQQCIDLPKGILLHKGETKTGNPKYWFEFDQIGKVSVSPSSAEKYQNNTVVLQLVKWYNKDTDKYKYSIRQKKGNKQTPNIDLLTFFKK